MALIGINKAAMKQQDNPFEKFCIREFEASIVITPNNPTTIKKGYQSVIHSGAIRQTAQVVRIISGGVEDGDQRLLRSGLKGVVRFKFHAYPEYIKEGAPIVFRQDTTQGFGYITKVFP